MDEKVESERESGMTLIIIVQVYVCKEKKERKKGIWILD